jgi:signal recognition particle receptor subunit beta
MAFLNEDTNELHLKILYAGSKGSGKTTNLQSLFKLTSSEVSTRFFDLHGMAKGGQFFDFLPISYGEASSHAIRLHLYTLPAHDLWDTVLTSLIVGIDGLVHVVDSRTEMLGENERQLQRLKTLLNRAGRSFSDIPLVLQFNHRDAKSATNIRALKAEFSRHSAAEIEAVAVQDIGVMETMESIADRILDTMENSGTMWSDKTALGLQ